MAAILLKIQFRPLPKRLVGVTRSIPKTGRGDGRAEATGGRSDGRGGATEMEMRNFT